MKKEQKHILVDENTHKRVKMLAAERGTTLGDVIKKLLEDVKNV